MTTYLIPTVFSGKGNVALEYRVVTRKKDMRTKFCKKNEKYIVNPQILIVEIGKYNPTIKGERIIMKNGNDAYKFGVEVYRGIF